MEDKMLNKRKFDYSWVIVALCILTLFVALAFCSGTKGLFLKPITEYLGVERSLFSINDTIRYVATTIVYLFFGSLIKKFGAKPLLLTGIASLIGSMALYAVAESIFVFYIGGFLLGVGVAFSSTTMMGYVINKWVKKNKGTIMGIVFASNGVGGAFASPIVSSFIAKAPDGYKNAYWLIVFMLAILFVILLIFFRSAPKNQDENAEPYKKKKRGNSWVGIDYNTAKKKTYFYLTCVCVFFTGFMLQGVGGVSYAHLGDVGISTEVIGTIASIGSIVLAVSKFLVGFIYDKLGLRFVVSVCTMCAVIGMILLYMVDSSNTGLVIAIIYKVLVNIALPLETIMLPIYALDLFGEKSYAKILGILSALCTAGYAVASPIMNIFFDTLGSYKLAFILCAAIMLFVFITLQIIITNASKVRKSIEEAE